MKMIPYALIDVHHHILFCEKIASGEIGLITHALRKADVESALNSEGIEYVYDGTDSQNGQYVSYWRVDASLLDDMIGQADVWEKE